MYGGKIYTPTDEDLQKSFQDYTADAQRRLSHDQQFPNEPKQLKPGEEVKLDSSGRIQLSRQMNVIGIRELLTKNIFDKNPDREFYIVEGFPLNWMYPHLEPHGLIMKINRQELSELSDEIIQRDSDYWTKFLTPMIGGWLRPDSTIGEVAAFAEKIHVKKDLSGFAGDPQFVQNEYWSQNVFQIAECHRRSLRMARATRGGRGGKETHERRGGFCLPPGLGVVSLFDRNRCSLCELFDESEPPG